MLGHEVDFGIDVFGRPKVYSDAETIARIFINNLYLEEGQFPSMPHIGIGLRKILNKNFEDIDMEELIGKMQSQSKELFPHIDVGSIVVRLMNQGAQNESLYIKVPLLIDKKDLYIKAIPGDEVQFNYTITESI